MSELGFHIRMSLDDGRVIATTTAARRTLARVVLTVGEGCQLLAVRAPDNHLHMVASCSRCEAGMLVRGIGKSLHHRLALSSQFTQPHFEPIRSQRHLYHAVRYAFRQDERHGVDVDPWAEASNLPDLLGLRRAGRHTAVNMARLLPRIRPEELAARLGITYELLLRGDISSHSLEQLADAAAATIAMPDLLGRTPEIVEARRAAIHLIGPTIPAPRLAELLGTTKRTVFRLMRQPADPVLVEAVARQLRLRTAAARPPAVACPDWDPTGTG